ncbi:uncharacterized protein LOC116288595 [Actinia tenebrosa]|uniref:Uncharacterized protein LOC116288595 n=1 Tax=Actinia tenebrosa TaxID=6105 RepID=A0A6P8HF64_ACTTE|nr:uncharacterized protein LOC116288595 [Actinia tenebrosa]
MSKFDEKFRGSFDVSKNNQESVASQSRNLKRSQDELSLSSSSGSEVLQQSQTQDIAKKPKQMQESCGEICVGSEEKSPPVVAKCHQNNPGFKGPEMKGPNLQAEGARLETVLRDIGQETKMLFLKWSHPFSESEAFEAFCPSRLDELLSEANQLELHLKKQKEQLKNRLSDLSKTLKLQMK